MSHVPARPTITAAPKVVELFIGNVGASYSGENNKRFMNHGTSLQVELKDIEEKPVRGDRKAFKVTVPHDKAQEAVSIWPKDITAERYMAPRLRIRPAKTSNTQARTNGNNRNHTNNGNSRHSNSSGNNRNNNRGNDSDFFSDSPPMLPVGRSNFHGSQPLHLASTHPVTVDQIDQHD